MTGVTDDFQRALGDFLAASQLSAAVAAKGGRQPCPTRARRGFSDVVSADGNSIAVGGIGDSSFLVTWSADDGSDWQVRDELPAEMGGITATAAGFFANGCISPVAENGYDAALLTSPEGVTWQVDPRSDALGGSGDQFAGSIYFTAEGRIVMAGSSDGSGAVWVSETPESPLERVAGDLFGEVPHIVDVFEGPDGLIAIGSGAGK